MPKGSDGGDAVGSFAALLSQPAGLRLELRGQHPRLFFDARAVADLRRKASSDPVAWQLFIEHARALRSQPPAPPAQERGAHYQVGLALPEPALAFLITREARYLNQARQWTRAAMAYEPWGYTYSKPNQDIPAAFLLYGLSFSYDLLYADLSPAERAQMRAVISEKAALLYDYYKPRRGRRYSFSQNHTFINAAAIGFAGIVLDGEHEEAERWWVFSRAVFDRVVRTYSPDGYYYEGYHYFEFSVPWIVHYLDALEFNTTQRWYERLRLDLAKYYVAHSLLPDGSAFDFGDIGRGAQDRMAGVKDILGAHNILYRLAARYRDPDANTVADWAWKTLKLPWREPLWTFVWRKGDASTGIDVMPRFYHFRNADTVYYRSDWTLEATAFAFRAGPPEGHHVSSLQRRIPEWRLSTGHVHPDAGSFIVFARGAYLAGDAGYTGVKMTEHHNALLIDGRGQENDGRHEVFKEVPYGQLDRIRILEATATHGEIRIVAEAAAAYPRSLGVIRWLRTLRFDMADSFEIIDSVRSEVERSVSFLLHADEGVTRQGPKSFILNARQGTLIVQVEEPPGVQAAIDPQWVITQGRPGSVEKGEWERRGFRLTLTSAPAHHSEFRVKLQVGRRTDSSDGDKARESVRPRT